MTTTTTAAAADGRRTVDCSETRWKLEVGRRKKLLHRQTVAQLRSSFVRCTVGLGSDWLADSLTHSRCTTRIPCYSYLRIYFHIILDIVNTFNGRIRVKNVSLNCIMWCRYRVLVLRRFGCVCVAASGAARRQRATSGFRCGDRKMVNGVYSLDLVYLCRVIE